MIFWIIYLSNIISLTLLGNLSLLLVLRIKLLILPIFLYRCKLLNYENLIRMANAEISLTLYYKVQRKPLLYLLLQNHQAMGKSLHCIVQN